MKRRFGFLAELKGAMAAVAALMVLSAAAAPSLALAQSNTAAATNAAATNAAAPAAAPAAAAPAAPAAPVENKK